MRIEDQVESLEFRVTINLHLTGTARTATSYINWHVEREIDLCVHYKTFAHDITAGVLVFPIDKISPLWEMSSFLVQKFRLV